MRIALLLLLTLAAGCRGVTAPATSPDRAADELCRRWARNDSGPVRVVDDSMYTSHGYLVLVGRLLSEETGRPVRLWQISGTVDHYATSAQDVPVNFCGAPHGVLEIWRVGWVGRTRIEVLTHGRWSSQPNGRFRVVAHLDSLHLNQPNAPYICLGARFNLGSGSLFDADYGTPNPAYIHPAITAGRMAE